MILVGEPSGQSLWVRRLFIIKAGVDRDPIKPGVEGGLGFEVGQVPVRFQKNVLGRILRILPVSQHVLAKVVDLILILADELFECR